ncbi:hypothetical protein L1785_16685 [Antribacter sp. KLBMP9083]|uniref:Uncharacterized protein n=1 Tax=Antribacter soli TaxID=2910976 RepID=A0AA41QGB0_9MICO|nr:hypothetical protein [Antribacter soli]MCF4122617.1 hypothetical protein [Antribacter soli]
MSSPLTRAALQRLTLAATLLLVLYGWSSLPLDLLSPGFYEQTRTVMAAVAAASVVPGLVLAAAAATRRSRTFLLVTTVVTVLHLCAVLAVGLLAAAGAPPGRGWDGVGPAAGQLLLALTGLGFAWWGITRPVSRPWIGVVPVLLAPFVPALGVALLGAPYLFVYVVLSGGGFTVLAAVGAAALLGLPGRGSRVAGTLLVAWVAGDRLAPPVGVGGLPAAQSAGIGADPAMPAALQLVVLLAALVCGAVAVLPARPEASWEVEPTTTPTAEPAATDEPAGSSGPMSRADLRRAAGGAALAVVVLTLLLELPKLFAFGPGINPGGAGAVFLLQFLADAAIPAAAAVVAGAATSGSRPVLALASGFSGLVAGGALLAGAVTGVGVLGLDVQSYLPLAALAMSLALAWAATARTGATATALRWAAVVPPLLLVSPLTLLADPSRMVYARDPMFATYVADTLPALGAVAAAALLGYASRTIRIVAAVLLGVLAVASFGDVAGGAGMLRRLILLDGLTIAGYSLACLLVVASVLAPARAGSWRP